MRHERIAAEHEVLLHLEHVAGAATTAQLVTAAHLSQAPPHVVRALEQLPDQQWASAEDAVAAIGSGWRPGGSLRDVPAGEADGDP